jgi:DNA segregation ATPase FtsK/SpoIIIE-like protein
MLGGARSAAEIGGIVRDQAHPERVAVVAAVVFVGSVVAMVLSWQVGVVVGLALGVVATVAIGVSMQQEADGIPHDGEIDFDSPGPDELGRDVRRMRARLGDDWPDFVRAAALVTASQWASTDGLQRDLGVPASRARYLLDLLEQEGFVGRAWGTTPRTVLVPATSVGDVRRLLHA